MIDLSIIIPCYNEGELLRNNLYKLVNFLKNKKIDYEIIVVNDGSKNNSLQFLNQFKYKELNSLNLKGYRIVSYKTNKGKGYAVKKGLEKARGEYSLFMDADFSTSLVEILKFWNKRKSADILIGDRTAYIENLEDKTLIRKILSWGCKYLTKIIIPINYKDTQCGFKFFKTSISKELIKKQIINRFAFDIEYLYIAKLNDFTVQELPVRWKDDKNSQVKVLSSSINVFKDLIKIRLNSFKYRNNFFERKYIDI